MASISDNQKKSRGRPATGSEPMWGVRFTPEARARVDAWAEAQKVSRAEAIRRLVDKGLAAE